MVLTSPGESVRLWFPSRTRASFEENAADWLSPSAGSGSQTAPGGWTPDNPVSRDEEEEFRVGGTRGAVTGFTCQPRVTQRPGVPLLIKRCRHSLGKDYIRLLQERKRRKRRRTSNPWS